MPTSFDQVSWVSGRSRVFGIVGHPIEQVRSPEMVSAEFIKRRRDAVMIPIHVLAEDFDTVVRALMRVQNLDGLVFTIPFKQAAMAFADQIGAQAQMAGAVNALARRADGAWVADIFDGAGCVEAFRRRGLSFAGQRVTLIGAGGAGSAIGIAVAHEKPRSMRLWDPDATRVSDLAAMVRRVDPAIRVEVAPPTVEHVDVLLNASPIGMLGDPRLPIETSHIAPSTVVFDAIVMPERTPLLALAEACGCEIVRGREMMRGQIARIVDFLLQTGTGDPS